MNRNNMQNLNIPICTCFSINYKNCKKYCNFICNKVLQRVCTKGGINCWLA